MSEGLATDLDQASEVPEITPAEKKYSQEELEHVVHARLMKEREKLEKAKAQSQNQSRLPGGIGSQGLSLEEIDARMDAKLQGVIEKAGQKAVAQKILGDFSSRIDPYPEIKQQLVEFGIADFPELVQLSLNVDNTAAVLKELMDNPSKAISISSLYGRRPELARKEMARISSSIKENEASSNLKSKEPLSQIKSSATAVDDGGKKSVQDYMKQYRNSYRGNR